MLAFVQLPVARQDPVLIGEPRVQRRAGERREDGEAREVDGGLDRELRCRLEDVQVVVIETEDEASLQRDAEVVQVSDELAVVDRAVEAFAGVAKAAVSVVFAMA